MKACTKCHLQKGDDCFYKDKNRKDGLFPQCKSCFKLYRQSEHGAQLHREANLRFSKTSKGKVCSARIQKRYQQSPKGAEMYRQAARRRIAKKHTVDCLSNEELAIVRQRFDNRCFRCGDTKRLEIDHHYPLSGGYGLTLENAVLLCRACNASKSDRLPDKFYSIEELMILNALLS